MARVKSKKYDGVYISELASGDKSYYITYKHNKKSVWVKIGLHSQGIRENFCFQKRSEQLNKIRLGEDVTIGKKKRSEVTLNHFANDYFKDKEFHNKGLEVERQRYNKHIKDTIGLMYVDEINKEVLNSLQKQKVNEGYANQTVNHIVQFIKTIINHAINENKYTKKNPCDEIKLLRVQNDRDRYLTKDEVRLLLNEVDDNEQLSLFVRLALTTGARFQGVMDIKKKDVNFSNNTISLHDHKNSTKYIGFFSDSMKELLLLHVKDKGENDFILEYSRSNISKRLLKILNDLFNDGLNVKDAQNRVVIHTLRHTFASHLAINNTPIYTIQKLMNHKDIKMTLRYAKLAPDSGKEMVQNLYI